MSKNKQVLDFHLTIDVKNLIKELINLHIHSEILFSEIKKNFYKLRIDLREIYESIDLYGNGLISLNDVKYYYFLYLFSCDTCFIILKFL